MLQLTKRSGQLEDLNVEQIHTMVDFACEGLSDVSMSAVVMGAQIQFTEGITTDSIQNLLVKSASSLITLEQPNYQYVAARLLLFGLYKSLYPNWSTIGFPSLHTHLVSNSEVYDVEFLTDRHTELEFAHVDLNIDYNRDYNFTYSGIQQLVDKYLLKNRITGKVYETPQQLYALVAMTIFADYPLESRIDKVVDCYNKISLWQINLPTPVLVSIRSKNKGAASCCLLEISDSIDSIAIGISQILKGTAANMGMGVNLGSIRSVGSSVRNGDVVHTGIIPILKTIEASVKSCTQSSRGGCFAPGTKVYIVSLIELNCNKLSPGALETYHNSIDTAANHYNRDFGSYGLSPLALSLVNIEDVTVGQYVLSFDTDNTEYQVNRVLTVWNPIIEETDQITITTDHIELDTTNSHKLWVYPNSREDCGCWIRADEIRRGDSLLHVDANLHKVTKVNQYPGDACMYYDLEVENTHCYFVGQGQDYSTNNLYLSHNSATVFVPVWNYEIPDIIQLKNNKGTADSRVKNLDYAIVMSKLFYQRFLDNQDISLFSTSETPDLYESFGTEHFNDMYMYYENSDVRRKVVSMQKLFLDIVRERSETGRIYIMNIDNANEHSPFIDTVRQSNLCLHPDMHILTDKGYIKIGELEDREVNVWNGFEFSTTIIRKTGENQKMVSMCTENYDEIICTPYHKFYVITDDGIVEKRAVDLVSGDKLMEHDFPSGGVFDTYNHLTNSVFHVVYEVDGLYDSFCCTEPLRGTIVVNGIITGNCLEILQPSRSLDKFSQLE